MEQYKCIGCGSIMQNDSENTVGFNPKKTIEDGDICKRCFKLKNYGEVIDYDIDNSEYKGILEQVKNTDGIVLHIVDIFDFNASIVPNLRDYIGNNKLCIVINKRDLLPSAVSDNKIEIWANTILKSYGLDAEKAIVISAAKGHGVPKIIDYVRKNSGVGSIYVVGMANAGKSTLINAIIKDLSSSQDEVITTSVLPGTTYSTLEIELAEDTYLIDTPGLVNENAITNMVDFNTLKEIIPKKEIKPKTYFLNPKQAIFIGGLACVELLDNSVEGKTTFSFYKSNDVELHRTKSENREQIFRDHAGTMLVPALENVEFDYEDFVVSREQDIYIAGLCFVNVKPEEKITIRVHKPKGIDCGLRNILI